MPKVKTNSGAKKTKKQKRNLTHFGVIDRVDESNVKELLGLK